MNFKLFTSTLLCVVALSAFGCSDDNDESKINTCDQDCSAMTGGPFEKYCGRVNGKYSCLNKCDVQAEGETAPFCHKDTSNNTMVSTVQQCAQDDDGNFYENGYKEQICTDGCGDEGAGLCNTGVPHVENNCKTVNTPIEYVVTTVNGEQSCVFKCHGDKEGENAPFCYEYNSIHYSGMTTCAKDDNGVLYGTLKFDDCEGACVAETGLCEKNSTPE